MALEGLDMGIRRALRAWRMIPSDAEEETMRMLFKYDRKGVLLRSGE